MFISLTPAVGFGQSHVSAVRDDKFFDKPTITTAFSALAPIACCVTMCTVRSGALAGISQSESSFSCVSSGAQLYSEPLQVLLLCLCIHNNVVQRNDIGAPCHTGHNPELVQYTVVNNAIFSLSDSATFTCKYLEASSSVLNQRIPTRASKVSSIRRHSHSCICVTLQPQLSILRLSLSSTDSVIAINGWLNVALFQIDLKPSHTVDQRMKSSNVYRNHVSGMNVGGGVEIPLLSAVPLQAPL
ncbi:hypothetical protein T03_7760 [Trichinella britovi]|uniref:Uncharacterized protein n=1 Tax=Trichinella britovi TaxID=45882 RepID=A0A0V1D3U3_TRIBR|nr:hypothetical protein T03_7760 [Trichinella britovi]